MREGEGVHLPAGITDDRPGIWISYVPAEEAERDLSALTRLRDHRLVAMSEHEWESLKIGAGPPPLRVEEGWLLIHHGVSGELVQGWAQQPAVHYAAGAMLLDAGRRRRASSPAAASRCSSPESEEERSGTVDNVVFPTAIEAVDGRSFVFYGMADSRIGVAELERA